MNRHYETRCVVCDLSVLIAHHRETSIKIQVTVNIRKNTMSQKSNDRFLRLGVIFENLR